MSTTSLPAAHNRIERIAQGLLIFSPICMILGRAPLEVALSSIALLFVIQSIITKKTDWLRVRWVQVAFALWAYLWLRNLFVSDETLRAVTSGLVWIRYPLFSAALAYWLLRDARMQRALLLSLTAMMLFFIIDGFFQYQTGIDFLGREALKYKYHLRLTGPFSTPRLGISMAWLFLPVVAYWLVKNPFNISKHKHVMALGFYILIMGMVFISNDRMAFIFSLFGSGLLWAFSPCLRKTLFFCAALSSMLIGVTMISDSAFFDRQFSQTGKEIVAFSQGSYGKSFAEGWQLTKMHPFFGVGGKQYARACRAEIKLQTPSAFCGLHPHNFYLDWSAEYGFIGVSGMLALILIWFNMARTHWRFIRKDALSAALLVTLIIHFWPAAVVTSQFTLWSAYPQFLVIGWFIAHLAQLTQTETQT
jgi:O-antigen ligase